MNNEQWFDLGDGFSTTSTDIERVFGEYRVGGVYDVDQILSVCEANEWTRWRSFWQRVKTGEIEL